jgi:hypothetical protein
MIYTIKFLMVHESMEEAAAPAVNKETKIGPNFNIHNGDVDISHHKTPSESPCIPNFGVQAVWNSSGLIMRSSPVGGRLW